MPRPSAITGIGELPHVRGTTQTTVEMVLDAARPAMGDAGLMPSRIDDSNFVAFARGPPQAESAHLG